MTTEHPIPARLNLVLTGISAAGCVILLGVASHAPAWWLRFLAIAGFTLLGNTVFALLHEAVHRILHPVRGINEAAGVLLAALFPTSLAFQRACHLGHHRRNRTDAELFDQVQPRENRLLKALQFYGIFTGFYWPLVPLGCLLVALFPWAPRALSRRRSELQEQTGTVAMLSGVAPVPLWRIPLEALVALALHAGLILSGFVTVWMWLACYLAFGWIWGSLQYADHAFSVRHIREGAWNLRVSAPVRWIFLNYHLHLNHHRRPDVPWLRLPKLTRSEDPYPTFWSIYRQMWRGPRPAQDLDARQPDAALEAILQGQA